MTATTTKVILTAGFGGCLALMLGLAWHEGRSLRTARHAAEDLERRRTALQFEARAAERRIAEARRDGAIIRDILAVQWRDERASFQVGAPPRTGEPGRMAVMASNPSLRELGRRAFRAGILRNLEPFFRALNLDPDQIAGFAVLECQHWDAQVDILATASSQGVPIRDPAVATLMDDEKARYQSAQERLLGDSGFRQLQQFLRVQPVMGVVDTVARAVAYSPAPLTGPQGEQLAQLLANTSGDYRAGGDASTATVDWPAALAQARALLLPPQVAALEAVYDRRQIADLATRFYAGGDAPIVPTVPRQGSPQ